MTRVDTHRVFDQIWKRHLVKHRGAAYDWMRLVLGVKRKTRISHLNEDQRKALVAKVYEAFPQLRTKAFFLTTDPFA